MSRPCTCRACGHKFDGPPCLHEYVAPKCPDCGNEDVDEPGAAHTLIVYDDDSSDALFITTDARMKASKTEIASVAIGFDEPFESEQRKYADELVRRYNSHAALVAELATRDREFQAMFKEAVAYKERCAALVAALECEAALDMPTAEGYAVLNRHGWANGADGRLAREFVRDMRTAALRATQEQP